MLYGLNHRLKKEEERVSELENSPVVINPFEERKKKKERLRKLNRASATCGTQQYTIHV